MIIYVSYKFYESILFTHNHIFELLFHLLVKQVRFYALEHHPMLQTIRSFERLILATAQERVVLQETDSASPNERLYHHRLNLCKGDVLREIMVCHNHQCNLAETALAGCAYSQLISVFFSFTHFAQASSHFTKLKQAVEEHVRENTTVIVTADTTVSTHALCADCEELTSMMIGVKTNLSTATKETTSQTQRGAEQYTKKVLEFKHMFTKHFRYLKWRYSPI